MTALAILGSATSTSLMSRGRSMTTDLPTPSGTNCEAASLATTLIAGARGSPNIGGSAAGAQPVSARPIAAIKPKSSAVRISELFPISGPSLISSRRAGRGHTETHHIHAATTRPFISCLGLVLAGIDDAAQSKGECPQLSRYRERFRPRCQLKGSRLADDHT